MDWKKHGSRSFLLSLPNFRWMTPLKRTQVCSRYTGSYSMGKGRVGIVWCAFKESALHLIIEKEFKE